jgi:hypothetical protein
MAVHDGGGSQTVRITIPATDLHLLGAFYALPHAEQDLVRQLILMIGASASGESSVQATVRSLLDP